MGPLGSLGPRAPFTRGEVTLKKAHHLLKKDDGPLKKDGHLFLIVHIMFITLQYSWRKMISPRMMQYTAPMVYLSTNYAPKSPFKVRLILRMALAQNELVRA